MPIHSFMLKLIIQIDYIRDSKSFTGEASSRSPIWLETRGGFKPM
uniref:Uncharacterized protein n=1 Tax=Arundo donax TaxID=35708 RepID=A0A0A9AHZ7_ARUDO